MKCVRDNMLVKWSMVLGLVLRDTASLNMTFYKHNIKTNPSTMFHLTNILSLTHLTIHFMPNIGIYFFYHLNGIQHKTRLIPDRAMTRWLWPCTGLILQKLDGSYQLHYLQPSISLTYTHHFRQNDTMITVCLTTFLSYFSKPYGYKIPRCFLSIIMQFSLDLCPWSDKRNVGVGLLLSVGIFFSTIITLDMTPKKKNQNQQHLFTRT